MMLPGTTIELSSAGAQKIHESLRGQCGICGSLMMLFFVPVGLAWALFVVIYAVASLIFMIQAIVVGSETVNDPNLLHCRDIANWLLVFGSFMLVSCLLSACCEGARARQAEGSSDSSKLIVLVPRVLNLFTFCWLCYGLSITYNPGVYPLCSASQWNVFSVMVLFMFWGMVALCVTTIALTCCLMPVLMANRKTPAGAAGSGAEKKRDEEQQGLLEKA